MKVSSRTKGLTEKQLLEIETKLNERNKRQKKGPHKSGSEKRASISQKVQGHNFEHFVRITEVILKL